MYKSKYKDKHKDRRERVSAGVDKTLYPDSIMDSPEIQQEQNIRNQGLKLLLDQLSSSVGYVKGQ